MNTNNVDVLLGLQWGDEGKGKEVDIKTPQYNITARFQGGPNAGHTLEFDGIQFIAHTIPSGIFHNMINLIGNGVVIDPVGLSNELFKLIDTGKIRWEDIKNRLLIAKDATFILPVHRLMDIAEDATKENPIGTTAKGIGPTILDKIGRNGLFMKDLHKDDFMKKFNTITNQHLLYIQKVLNYDISKAIIKENGEEYSFEEYTNTWMESLTTIKEISQIDCHNYIQKALKDGKKILAEGAQGSLLDIDFGTYPFVTCSNTISVGVCKGLGINPHQIGNIIGVIKAYTTRVGNGPFPTKLTNKDGEHLAKEGHEVGASTGRPRDCGWLDLPAIKYTISLNGNAENFEMIMTKLDVLKGLKELKVCIAYQDKEGNIIADDDFNAGHISQGYTPVYKEFEPWTEDISKVKKYEDLPTVTKTYVEYIEQELGTKITRIGIGPDRLQTIRKD
ncbi:MAG: adenylosuccinate synthase [bacterium]